MGVETGLCSRLTLAHSRDWGECVAEGLGIDLEPSWASCRETLLPLGRGGPDLALLRGLPGWPSLPGAAPLLPASSQLTQPSTSLAPVVAALGLTQSHR